MVFSKKYLSGAEEMKSVESFYQTPYVSKEFPQEMCDLIKEIKSQLSNAFSLPAPNPYLNEITCCGTQQKNFLKKGPIIIVKGKCSVFYKDEKFTLLKGQLPQAKYVFWFHSPVMNNSKRSESMMDLFVNYLNEMIEAKFSAALAAHFHIHAKITPGKLEFSFTGPSHSLPQVTRDVFKFLIFFEKLLDQKTFDVGKQNYIELMDNISLDNRVHGWELVNFLWANHYQLSTENIRQTQKIDYFSFIEFVKSFKRKMYIAGK